MGQRRGQSVTTCDFPYQRGVSQEILGTAKSFFYTLPMRRRLA